MYRIMLTFISGLAMIYTKSETGLHAIKDRHAVDITRAQRSALILFDGKRSVNEVLRQTAGLGVQPDDIAQLVHNGLLSGDAAGLADALPPVDFGGSTLPAPSVLPDAGLTADEQQRRYQVAYPLATQLTAALGLRGFRLNLAVERADGYAGLLQLLPQIEAAAGADQAAGLRAVMENVRH